MPPTAERRIRVAGQKPETPAEPPRPPFLTGSRAYGNPTDASDVDLVMYLPEDLEVRARELTGPLTDLLQAFSDRPTKAAFGKLNIIRCETSAQYDCWKKATDELIAMPFAVTRPQAIEYIDKVFNDAGVIGQSRNPPQVSGMDS